MAKLEESDKLFKQAGCKVIVLSFGSSKGAEAWLQETGTSIELFLDPDRQVYAFFGLDRSVSKVWSISTIHYYAAQKAQGRNLPRSVSGVEDDPLQMGGDFTLDRSLRIVLSHPSTSPTDRVSIEDVVRNLH